MEQFRLATCVRDPLTCSMLFETLPVLVDWCDRISWSLDWAINGWRYVGRAADLSSIKIIAPFQDGSDGTRQTFAGFVVLTDTGINFGEVRLAVHIGSSSWSPPAAQDRVSYCSVGDIPKVLGWLLDKPREVAPPERACLTFVEFFAAKVKGLSVDPLSASALWHDQNLLSDDERYWDHFITSCALVLSKRTTPGSLDVIGTLSIGLQRRSLHGILRCAVESGDFRGLNDLIHLKPWLSQLSGN
jgi:hypothetical protein